MSQLIALGFKNEAGADAFVDKLQKLQKEQIVGLQDLVKVVRREDGKTKIHQGINLTAMGALSGGFWGMLIGLIFWVPWLGLAIGAATGAISGKLTDIGIDDEFIKETAEAIQPGEAGVFMLIGEATTDKLEDEIKGTDAKVIKTNLTHEQEAHLRELFPTE